MRGTSFIIAAASLMASSASASDASLVFKGTCVDTSKAERPTATPACMDKLKSAGSPVFETYRAILSTKGGNGSEYVFIHKRFAEAAGVKDDDQISEFGGAPAENSNAKPIKLLQTLRSEQERTVDGTDAKEK